MNIIKIASFSDKNEGGNPAGVSLCEKMPSELVMQQVAAEVGFSETAFAEMQGDTNHWRVRYFSPESEVPFCGHATIALGAALAQKYGNGNYQLSLNNTDISVRGIRDNNQYIAALQSPETHFKTLPDEEIKTALQLFGYNRTQLSSNIPPACIHGGADHYVFVLNDRQALSAMDYDLNAGRDFMNKRNLITVMFVFAESTRVFHARNAFASGGVFEDPATGAAAAAFSGYLRDIRCPSDGKITITQGEDMGMASIITTEFTSEIGSSINVSGATRLLT